MGDVVKSNKDTKAQVIGKTIFKLVIVSLIVGWGMSFFDITPKSILENFGETVTQVYSTLTSWIEALVPYILLGATVVLPIWAILALLKMGGRKKKNDP